MNGSRSLLKYKLVAVDDALRYRFAIGRGDLVMTYMSMFLGNFKKLISKDVSSKF